MSTEKIPSEESEQPQTPESVLSENLEEYVEKHALLGKITTVALYEGKKIEMSDEMPQILITEKLNGCTATVVSTEHEDKTRSVQLVHFPPFFLEQHLKKIESLADEQDIAALKKEALIYTASRRQENVEKIEAHLRNIFGDNVNIISKSYSENTNDPEAGILAVEVSANPEDPLIYRMKEEDLDQP